MPLREPQGYAAPDARTWNCWTCLEPRVPDYAAANFEDRVKADGADFIANVPPTPRRLRPKVAWSLLRYVFLLAHVCYRR
jgi:hypothetical protein